MRNVFCKLIFAIAITMTWMVGKAQTANQAAVYYNNFVQHLSNGSKPAAYAALYQGYEAYTKILGAQTETSSHQQAKTALKNMFPYLEQAAYFYSSENDQNKTLQYAQAYVELSVMPAMQDMDLTLSANYVTLTKLAAAGTWRSRDMEKAIPMLTAYLKTGDQSMRREAYNNLGVAYSKLKNYTQARLVLEEGLKQYPSDANMLLAMVDNCSKGGDDKALQRYLPQAIAVLPSTDRRMPTLLNMLGMLQENSQQYENAFATFTRLRQLMPNDLNTARHQADNCYNAGIYQMRLSMDAKSKSIAKQYKQQAKPFFQQAEPLLQDIMASDPLSVKYAFALATVYGCLGETAKLQAINEKIATLGYEPVKYDGNKDLPPLLAIKDIDPKPSDPGKQPLHSPTPSPKPSPTPEPKTVPEPMTIPDVDINIPENRPNNVNTFAVIIANEDYGKVAKVPMANNDGKVFAEYCQKVLGMPKENVRAYYDVTSLEMEDALDDIKGIAATYHGDLNVIFFYAGHGVPDESTKEAYLLPIDANGRSTTGCKSLNSLYNDLASLNAHCVTVFLDACFSGSVRGEGMIASARGVAIKPKPDTAKGNMVIFSAVSDAQTALPYEEKQHGLFTYYLLKKLQETKGNVTLGELEKYLTEKVSQRAQVVNRKPQTPTVKPSFDFGDRWKKLKLTYKK